MSLIASSPIFMIEPLPYCFSICESAAANALDLLSSIACVPLVLGWHLRQLGWANTGYCIYAQYCGLVDRPLSTREKILRRQKDGESCVPRPRRHGLSDGRPPGQKGRPRRDRLQPHGGQGPAVGEGIRRQVRRDPARGGQGL